MQNDQNLIRIFNMNPDGLFPKSYTSGWLACWISKNPKLMYGTIRIIGKSKWTVSPPFPALLLPLMALFASDHPSSFLICPESSFLTVRKLLLLWSRVILVHILAFRATWGQLWGMGVSLWIEQALSYTKTPPHPASCSQSPPGSLKPKGTNWKKLSSSPCWEHFVNC